MIKFKAGDSTEQGVRCLADSFQVEYIDRGGTKIRRRWNIDGTGAVDDVISEAEYVKAINESTKRTAG